jgi:hypothetical protein
LDGLAQPFGGVQVGPEVGQPGFHIANKEETSGMAIALNEGVFPLTVAASHVA